MKKLFLVRIIMAKRVYFEVETLDIIGETSQLIIASDEQGKEVRLLTEKLNQVKSHNPNFDFSEPITLSTYCRPNELRDTKKRLLPALQSEIDKLHNKISMMNVLMKKEKPVLLQRISTPEGVSEEITNNTWKHYRKIDNETDIWTYTHQITQELVYCVVFSNFVIKEFSEFQIKKMHDFVQSL